MGYTLLLFNIAMEHFPFIEDLWWFPIKNDYVPVRYVKKPKGIYIYNHQYNVGDPWKDRTIFFNDGNFMFLFGMNGWELL